MVVRANGNFVDYAADGEGLGLAIAHARKTPVYCDVYDADFESSHLVVNWAVYAAGVLAEPVVAAAAAELVDADHGEHIDVAAGQVLVLAPDAGPLDAVELAPHCDNVAAAAVVEHETHSAAGNSVENAAVAAAVVVYADSELDSAAKGHH